MGVLFEQHTKMLTAGMLSDTKQKWSIKVSQTSVNRPPQLLVLPFTSKYLVILGQA